MGGITQRENFASFSSLTNDRERTATVRLTFHLRGFIVNIRMM